MQTTFIAVQCFQCSTMQVKQQKKSGNKWTCVVCNEKQSVRKVFARAFMAKDVGKFVQNFNMSRQLTEQKRDAELLEGNYIKEENKHIGDIGNHFLSNEGNKKKQTDWSEYVDYEPDCGKLENDELIEGDGSEAMIVTEMPKTLFKKLKTSHHYAAMSDCDHGKKLCKPVFAKRNVAKRQSSHFQDLEPVEVQETTNIGTIKFQPSDRASKWNRFKMNIQEDSLRVTPVHKPTVADTGSVLKSNNDNKRNFVFKTQALNRYTTAKEQVSKWSDYMTEEDDDNVLIRGRKASLDQSNQLKNDEFEMLLNDQRVEEDVHPDFL